ncbi:MAG: EVE domain-containing protein [Proteobacteria bacterium]|nr:EVE domain-containing protein [Pseudomonadota bacterium]
MQKSNSYWLLKSEPNSYSWHQMLHDKKTVWDGVRNYQARNHLKAMKYQDLCFFYHSGKKSEIMGIVSVASEHYQDPDHPKFVRINVEIKQALQNPVSLKTIKSYAEFYDTELIKQPRLSVIKLSSAQFEKIIQLSKHRKA